MGFQWNLTSVSLPSRLISTNVCTCIGWVGGKAAAVSVCQLAVQRVKCGQLVPNYWRRAISSGAQGRKGGNVPSCAVAEQAQAGGGHRMRQLRLACSAGSNRGSSSSSASPQSPPCGGS